MPIAYREEVEIQTHVHAPVLTRKTINIFISDVQLKIYNFFAVFSIVSDLDLSKLEKWKCEFVHFLSLATKMRGDFYSL